MVRALLILTIVCGLLLNSSCSKETNKDAVVPQIIPKPTSVITGKGHFELSSETFYAGAMVFENANRFFLNYLKKAGITLKASPRVEPDIIIGIDMAVEEDGYILEVTKDRIEIKASTKVGAFYGVQTLRQLLPPELEGDKQLQMDAIEIPCVKIKDSPKFRYRGMHLDVARHFFPKEFVMEYIDHLAMLKMNYFHWHLTEDQGWRIEIEQYPRLTTHAAYRDETLIGHYNDQPQQFDGQRYGGFYTKEDIREIVEYARQNHITVIPEIEMPGHAQAAISAYPELGCSGDPVKVATKWGVFEDIYCPNQKTFAFLKGVLSEVIELFPGEYIHIGGDEAPKTRWKDCDHCQKLIRELGLADEHELQSWFIKEIETFLNSKGKKMIGWDEILEGGLAPNATVMSWRGVQGGIEAARAGHNVIMTPTSHAYFDYYQSDDADEPLAIGGYLPLEKVYGFDPIPSELNDEEAKYVLGAQGNVWTEYMKTEEQVEYMIFPRMLAMSEVIWSGPTENFDKDYSDFINRVEGFHSRLDAMAVNYANHLYTIEGDVIKGDNGYVSFALTTPTKGKQIRYRLNESVWSEYKDPIRILTDSKIEAIIYKENEKLSDTFEQKIRFHKGIQGKIMLNKDPHPSYAADGKEALINGISGSDTRYGDSEWLGFWGEYVEIDILLPEEQHIGAITTRFYHAPGQWIYAPDHIAGRVTLENGEVVANKSIPHIVEEANYASVKLTFSEGDKVVAKKIKLLVPNYGQIPEGAQGAGNKAWTFIDEIIIE